MIGASHREPRRRGPEGQDPEEPGPPQGPFDFRHLGSVGVSGFGALPGGGRAVVDPQPVACSEDGSWWRASDRVESWR